jgi:hypothetical protein
MKLAGFVMVMGCFGAALAAGCATTEATDNTDDRSQEVTGGESELVPGGDLCSAWHACYRSCQHVFAPCSTQRGCELLASCLTDCDARYPDATWMCEANDATAQQELAGATCRLLLPVGWNSKSSTCAETSGSGSLTMEDGDVYQAFGGTSPGLGRGRLTITCDDGVLRFSGKVCIPSRGGGSEP